MESIVDLLKEVMSNPSVGAFLILFFFLFVYALHKLKYIEDYVSYRSLRKYEKLIEATTSSSLKKVLIKKKDQEILFKVTGIAKVDLAKKVMELITHPSLVLYKRDLDYYRLNLDLKDNQIVLYPLSFFSRIGYIFLKLSGVMLLIFSLVIFELLVVKWAWRNHINLILTAEDVNAYVELAVYIMFFFVFGILFLLNTPRSNEKKMHKLLEEFNQL